jgi:hypothetical protein
MGWIIGALPPHLFFAAWSNAEWINTRVLRVVPFRHQLRMEASE